MSKFSFIMVPKQGDIFTQEAADSMINQRPMIKGLVTDDTMYENKGKVISAILQPDGHIHVTFEVRKTT